MILNINFLLAKMEQIIKVLRENLKHERIKKISVNISDQEYETLIDNLRRFEYMNLNENTKYFKEYIEIIEDIPEDDEIIELRNFLQLYMKYMDKEEISIKLLNEKLNKVSEFITDLSLEDDIKEANKNSLKRLNQLKIEKINQKIDNIKRKKDNLLKDITDIDKDTTKFDSYCRDLSEKISNLDKQINELEKEKSE